MMLFVVAGIYFLLAHRDRSSGAAMVIAAAVKVTGGLMLPFALASGGPRRGPDRRRDILIGAGVALSATAPPAVGLFRLWPLPLFGTIQEVPSQGDWDRIPRLIRTKLR